MSDGDTDREFERLAESLREEERERPVSLVARIGAVGMVTGFLVMVSGLLVWPLTGEPIWLARLAGAGFFLAAASTLGAALVIFVRER